MNRPFWPAAAVLVVTLLSGSYCSAQATAPASEPWTPDAPVKTEPEEEKSGWLFKSPMMNVGWPKFEMPSLKKDKATDEPGMFTESFQKMQSATRTAATKTRDTWNGAVDRVKMRLPGGDDGSGGTAVAKAEPKQHFWSNWFGEEKGADAPPVTAPPMIASEPGKQPR